MDNNTNKPEYANMTLGQWLLRIIQGILIGGGAIIPGISGGVLCVTFGIYQPMMAFIAHPIKSFRTYYKMFIPIFIGGGIGFLGFAELVKVLFDKSATLAVFLFVGLVAGTIPSLFAEAGKKGRSKGSWTSFAICLFIMFPILAFLNSGLSVNIEPNMWWFLFCGIVWGLSLIVPGLSSSSILLAIGLYQKMNDGIAALDFGVIIPLFIGIGLTAASLARVANYLFEKYYSIAYHTILGIVLASTLVIIPFVFTSALDVILSLVCFAGGFIVALAMANYGDRVNKTT